MTVYIVISPFTEFFLKQTPLVWGHHLVVAHSLAFSFNIPKIENFTKLLTQLFHTFAFAILPSLETIWQVGIVFRSPAIYLRRSLIIREYNGKFSDRITIQTSSLRTSSRRFVHTRLTSTKRFTNLNLSRCQKNQAILCSDCWYLMNFNTSIFEL